MSREIPVDALMFGVAEVPIEAVVKTGETFRNITVPGKKALIHEGTGKILGVVIRQKRVRGVRGCTGSPRRQARRAMRSKEAARKMKASLESVRNS